MFKSIFFACHGFCIKGEVHQKELRDPPPSNSTKYNSLNNIISHGLENRSLKAVRRKTVLQNIPTILCYRKYEPTFLSCLTGSLSKSRGVGGEVVGVLNRNLGRGVRPTQQNPDPLQDTKYVNFATLSKGKCCNFLPCLRLDQAGRLTTLKLAHKFAFSRILTKVHKISINYALEGEEK